MGVPTMTVTSIALGEADATNLLEEAKEMAETMPKVFIAMCIEEGDPGMYFTNMGNGEISYLLLGCLLESHGVFDGEED